MQRGSIWWAALPEPAGSMPGYRRPVLIIQADAYTRSRLGTVIGVVLTTNLRLEDAPGNVLLPATRTGLPRDSVANITQLITVDKSLLTEKAGELGSGDLARVEAGLRRVLDL